MTLLVVDGRLCAGATDVVRPVEGRGRRGRRPPHADDAVVALSEAGSGAIALAPGPAPGASVDALLAVARLMGLEAVRLPRERAVASWVVALAEWLCRRRYADPLRRVQTLAGAAHADLPAAPWNAPAIQVPALRPEVLARWAWHAWRPCRHCRGGGHSAAPCARCGVCRP